MDIEGVLGQVERPTEAGGAERLVHFCMRGAGAEAIGVGSFCRAGGRRGRRPVGKAAFQHLVFITLGFNLFLHRGQR